MKKRERGLAVRIIAPDVLRGIAIIAMLIAHAAPFVPQMPWIANVVRANINDLASPLFALVMGMAAQIVWNRSVGIGLTVVQQAARGVILIALGVWMATWGSWVAIVLQPLGLLLIVGVPLLLMGTRVLAVVTLVLAAASQPLVDLARGASASWVPSGPLLAELVGWTVTGHHYRLVNLLPFFLLGALLLRQGLRRGPTLWVMAVVAPLAYLARPVAERLGIVGVQSGDYLDTLHDLGLVFAVYVVVVLAVSARLKPRGERVRAAAVVIPFTAWGQLSLSLYLLHVGLIAVWNSTYGRPDSNLYLGWLVIVPGVSLIGWLWWRFVGTGPVEWLMGVAIGRRKRWRRADASERAELTPAPPSVSK